MITSICLIGAVVICSLSLIAYKDYKLKDTKDKISTNFNNINKLLDEKSKITIEELTKLVEWINVSYSQECLFELFTNSAITDFKEKNRISEDEFVKLVNFLIIIPNNLVSSKIKQTLDTITIKYTEYVKEYLSNVK